MALRKKYQSLGGNPLSIDLMVGGRFQTIEFKGGMKFPVARLPLFATSDPEVIQALETYPGYKLSYALIGSENLDEPVPLETLNEQILKGLDEFTGELVTVCLPSLSAARLHLKNNCNEVVRVDTRRVQLNEVFLKHGLILKLETDKN
jgi:hypothetical protein